MIPSILFKVVCLGRIKRSKERASTTPHKSTSEIRYLCKTLYTHAHCIYIIIHTHTRMYTWKHTSEILKKIKGRKSAVHVQATRLYASYFLSCAGPRRSNALITSMAMHGHGIALPFTSPNFSPCI